mmetsp:Transcript_86710/g.201757  ORF Transcript_86710/g.201757 Transcript_86710/m.201757 type:complete len:219 (+) Transcript_86710:530-1186(+)
MKQQRHLQLAALVRAGEPPRPLQPPAPRAPERPTPRPRGGARALGATPPLRLQPRDVGAALPPPAAGAPLPHVGAPPLAACAPPHAGAPPRGPCARSPRAPASPRFSYQSWAAGEDPLCHHSSGGPRSARSREASSAIERRASPLPFLAAPTSQPCGHQWHPHPKHPNHPPLRWAPRLLELGLSLLPGCQSLPCPSFHGASSQLCLRRQRSTRGPRLA